MGFVSCLSGKRLERSLFKQSKSSFGGIMPGSFSYIVSENGIRSSCYKWHKQMRFLTFRAKYFEGLFDLLIAIDSILNCWKIKRGIFSSHALETLEIFFCFILFENCRRVFYSLIIKLRKTLFQREENFLRKIRRS